MNIFEQTPPNRRRYGLAAFIGLIAGVVSAFVKWGAEVPLPPRSPVDMFNAACGPESLIRAAGQIDCSVTFSILRTFSSGLVGTDRSKFGCLYLRRACL